MARKVAVNILKLESTGFANRLIVGMKETEKAKTILPCLAWELDKRHCPLLRQERYRRSILKERWENQEFQESGAWSLCQGVIQSRWDWKLDLSHSMCAHSPSAWVKGDTGTNGWQHEKFWVEQREGGRVDKNGKVNRRQSARNRRRGRHLGTWSHHKRYAIFAEWF